jgi:hypothetical protein
VAQDNLKEANEYLRGGGKAKTGGGGGGAGVRNPQRHALQPMPRMTLEELHHSGWNYETPVVVKGVGEALGWQYAAFDLPELKRRFGGERVDYYPHNMVDSSGVKPMFSTLGEAIDAIDAPLGFYDPGSRGTYIQWNVRSRMWATLGLNVTLPAAFTTDAAWLDECFLSEETRDRFFIDTHWNMVLVGEEGAGMFNHMDTLRSASWQAQLRGTKRWHLCDVDQSPYVYGAGTVDVFDPDYAEYPLLLNATCYQDDVEEGDLVFYPKDYWHQTLNLATPSVAFSGTLVTPENTDTISAELAKDCSGGGRIFKRSEPMCAQLEACMARWKAGEFPGVGPHEEGRRGLGRGGREL